MKRRIRNARERGASLIMVAGGIVVLLGVLALVIDLGILYVARNEAQRAADSAALAGAHTFITSGCTSTGGCVAGGPQEAIARGQAAIVAGQNAVLGEPVTLDPAADVSFSYPSSVEPQIAVTVRRTTERGNAIPTIFARMFKVFVGEVSASATAEAYNGGVANTCIVPFLVPNCDTNPAHLSPANASCGDPSTSKYPNGPAGNFVYLGSDGSYHIQNPGLYLSGAGVFGQPWTLHFSATDTPGPAGSAVPSHWYLVSFEGSNSKADLRNYILQCYPKTISCGDTLTPDPGKATGPVTQGVEDRINANGYGMNQGQDAITFNYPPDATYTIAPGANHNNGGPGSVVTAPIYDGMPLVPGATNQVKVIGFMDLFIKDVEKQNDQLVVNTAILNVSPCLQGGSPTGTTTSGSDIAIRLIRQ